MESISSRNLPLVLHTLSQIELAIDRLQERTKNIRSVDDFLSTPGGMEKLDAACMVLIAIGESIKNKVNYTPLKLLVNDMTLKTVMLPAKDMLDTMIDQRGTEYITPILESKLSEADSASAYDLLRQLDVDEQTVKNAVTNIYRRLVDQSVEGIMQSINISALVEDKINAMSIDELERLVQDVMKKELSAIINLGALIGFILGLLNLIL